jgi:hypothetical protein
MLARAVEVLARNTPPRLDVADLYAIVRSSDADLLVRSELPAALQAAAEGDEAPLLRLRRYLNAAGDEEGINAARFLATTCMEGGLPWATDSDPATRTNLLADAMLAAAGAYAPFTVTAVAASIPAALCVDWPATPRPPSAAGRPGPDVPVLVLAGREDLRTPLEDQRRAAAQYPNATVLPVAGVGHSVLGNDTTGCAVRGLRRFLAGRAVPPCPVSGRRLLEPALPAVQRLRDVPRPRGDVPARIGRTAVAVDLTVRDAVRWSFVELAGLRMFPGLRGGRVVVTRTAARLIDYEVVPGVRVSGTLGPKTANTLQVEGSGATGTLRVRDTTLRGVLDGERVTYRMFDPTPVSSG